MAILVHSTFSDKKNWEKIIKKKFKNEKIISIMDKNYFKEVKYAIVWNLPNHILKQLKNLKIIFSMGAGVDHILKLQSYTNTPIIIAFFIYPNCILIIDYKVIIVPMNSFP